MKKTENKRDLKRININMPADLLQIIDDFALVNGITRTTAITLICSERFSAKYFSEKK